MTEFNVDTAECKPDCKGFEMKGTWKLNMGPKSAESFEVTGNLKVPHVDINFNYIINARMQVNSNV